MGIKALRVWIFFEKQTQTHTQERGKKVLTHTSIKIGRLQIKYGTNLHKNVVPFRNAFKHISS